jgi:DnaJ family protein A protein 2
LEKKNKKFQRKGADLLMRQKITLVEALTGVDFTFKHLDGKVIRVQNAPGKIVKHGEIQTIEDQGMPFHKKSYKQGNLFIEFEVEFPDSITAAQKQHIEAAFGVPKKPDVKDVAETVQMIKHEEFHKNASAEGGQAEQEGSDDEEESHGGQKVGCQQQ